MRNIYNMKKWNELAKARMKETGLTQDKLAERLGVTQGAIGHWLNERREPTLEMISRILKEVGLPPLGVAYPFYQPDAAAKNKDSNAELLGDLSVWDEGDPLDEDDCEVPYYDEVEFAGGNGMTEVVEVTDRKLRFSSSTLRAAGVDCKSAACARLNGKSMERLILDGASIGFDRASTSIIDGEIYAFNHGGMLRVKYLHRMPSGAVRIRSENSEEFPDEFMSAAQYHEEVVMLGRVFWWSTVRRAPRT